MKFSNILNLALAALAAAVPTPTVDENSTPVLAKRTSITEACNIGYASTNGGTTGGHGGSTTTVSTLAQFTQAADSDTKRVIYIKGTIKGNARVKVKSDKTIVGAFGSKLEGVGLHITAAKNVIVRNLQISKVKEAYGDAINVRDSRNIWIDHVDVSSDLTSGKDYYDGLIDINHGSDWVTVSNSFLHDHVSWLWPSLAGDVLTTTLSGKPLWLATQTATPRRTRASSMLPTPTTSGLTSTHATPPSDSAPSTSITTTT